MEAPTSYTLHLEARQLARLRDKKRETGATVSEMIRRAIDAYLPEPPVEIVTREEVSR